MIIKLKDFNCCIRVIVCGECYIYTVFYLEKMKQIDPAIQTSSTPGLYLGPGLYLNGAFI